MRCRRPHLPAAKQVSFVPVGGRPRRDDRASAGGEPVVPAVPDAVCAGDRHRCLDDADLCSADQREHRTVCQVPQHRRAAGGIQPDQELGLGERPGRNSPALGLGVSVSLHADDAQALHDHLKAHGMPILVNPFDTPFGRTFVFKDPDGYPSPTAAKPRRTVALGSRSPGRPAAERPNQGTSPPAAPRSHWRTEQLDIACQAVSSANYVA